MQNLYKYTTFLQSPEIGPVDQDLRVLTVLNSLNHALLENPLEETSYSYASWKLPYNKHLHNKFYQILYVFGKWMRVKMMWREMINEVSGKTYRGIWIIGEMDRIRLCVHLLDYYFVQYFRYETWIRKNWKKVAKEKGYKDIRKYSSYLLDNQRNIVYEFINNKLEFDHYTELKLENHIKEQYKLSYKNYNTDHPEYYHAISKKFHHKRMIQ